MLKILGGLAVLLVLIAGGVWWLNTSNQQDLSASVDQTNPSTYLSTTTPASQASTATASSTSSPQVTTSPQKIMDATLHTSMGDITLQFLPSAAPNAVANFIKLAQSGFYDNTKFHRVIKGFMDQGGDPLTKDDTMMARWGTGGPGYQFSDEISPTALNNTGMVAMANSGPNTNGSQFFINAANNNFLDGKYTVFGTVIAGLDVVMAINNTPTDSSDRPLTPVVIKSITLK